MDPKLNRNSILKKSVVDEASPTTTFSRSHRRISFSGKKSVKEFLPGDDKATIWGTSYEESASAEGLQLQLTVNDKENINVEIIEINETSTDPLNIAKIKNKDCIQITKDQERNALKRDDKIYRNSDYSLNMTLSAQEKTYLKIKRMQDKANVLEDYKVDEQNDSLFATSITFSVNEMEDVKKKISNFDITLNDIKNNDDNISNEDRTLIKNLQLKKGLDNNNKICNINEVRSSVKRDNSISKDENAMDYDTLKILAIKPNKRSSNMLETLNLNTNQEDIMIDNKKTCKSGSIELHDKIYQKKLSSTNERRKKIILNSDLKESYINKKCEKFNNFNKTSTIYENIPEQHIGKNISINTQNIANKNIDNEYLKAMNFQIMNSKEDSTVVNNIELKENKHNEHKNKKTESTPAKECKFKQNIQTLKNVITNDDNGVEMSSNHDENISMKTRSNKNHITSDERDLPMISKTCKTKKFQFPKLEAKCRETNIFKTVKPSNINNIEFFPCTDKTLLVKEHPKSNLSSRQNIIFQTTISKIENNKELSLSPDNITPIETNEKINSKANNRPTRNVSAYNHEYNIALPFNPDSIMLTKEFIKNRQTINFQSAGCTDENNMELSISPENIIPLFKNPKFNLKQPNAKNRRTINFQTAEYIDENNRELSFNGGTEILSEEYSRLGSKNANIKVGQTINFRTAECNDKNDMELSLNSDEIISLEELQKIHSMVPNPKNRRTIHFQTTGYNEENDIELFTNPYNISALNPQKITSTQPNTKNRQTIHFQNAEFNDKNDMDKIMLVEETDELGSKIQNSANRQTINFQSAGCNDENNIELSINTDNIMPIVKNPNFKLNQPYANKNRQSLNLRNVNCNDENNIELSFNRTATKQQQMSVAKNAFAKTRQTINFQTAECVDKNDMEVSLNPNNILLNENFHTSEPEILNTKHRQTINFQNEHTEENNMEFSINPYNTSAVNPQKNTSTQPNTKNRQTIHFQKPEFNNKNDMDFSSNADKIMSAEELKELGSKIQNSANRQTINFQSADCNDENNMELSMNTDNIMPVVKNPNFKLNQPYAKKNRQSLNLRNVNCNDENNIELSFNRTATKQQQMSVAKNSFAKTRQTINFQTAECVDKNDMEVSLNPNNILLNENFHTSEPEILNTKHRQTINFQNEHTEENNMEFSINPYNTSAVNPQTNTSTQPNTKDRQTIHFQKPEFNNKNDMDFSSNADKIMSAEELKELGSKIQNSANRQTINFQSADCNDENNMELSINTDNIMPVVKNPNFNLKQPNVKKNLQSLKFRNFNCNDENNMELSFNRILTEQQMSVAKNSSAKTRQTIYFQTAECVDKNDMEVSLKPNNIFLNEDFHTSAPEILNPKNRQTINFQTDHTEENNMEFSINPYNTSAVNPQKNTSTQPNTKDGQTIHFQKPEFNNKNDMDFSSNADKIMSAEELKELGSKIQNSANRQTINFQSADCNDENNMELSINTDNIMPVVKNPNFKLNQPKKNRQSLNFRHVNCNDESNTELSFNRTVTKQQQMPVAKNSSAKSRQTINFQTAECIDKNDMEMSLNPNNIFLNEDFHTSEPEILNPKNRQTINFHTEENNMELSINPQKITSTQPNTKNRQTIHFQKAEFNDKNDMDFSLNPDTLMLVDEPKELGSKIQNSANRQTINFQSADCNDENNMELSINTDNIMPVVKNPNFKLNQPKKNRQSLNFRHVNCNDESNTELSFNRTVTKQQQMPVAKNSSAKSRQTINFQTAECIDKNDMEMSLNPNNIFLNEDFHTSEPEILNPKNRQTINFHTEENNMELSINPQKITSTQPNTKNRQTIHFQKAEFNDKNDMDFSLNPDTLMLVDEPKELGSKIQNSANRQTINFQSAGCNDGNNMELSINTDNIMPVVNNPNFNLKQPNVKKNLQSLKFRNFNCNDENNMELSFNRIVTEQQMSVAKNSSAKTRQTKNFQTAECVDKNDMEVSLKPNNIFLNEDFHTSAPEILNPKNRQTINFQTDHTGENNMELSINPYNTSAVNPQKIISTQSNTKNRQSIHFQKAAFNDKNDMDFSLNPDTIMLVEEPEELGSKIQNSANRQTINFQSSGCNDENNIELSINPDNIMAAVKYLKFNLKQPNVKNRQTINVQTAECSDKNEFSLNYNNEVSYKMETEIRNSENHQKINFETEHFDENNMELSIKQELISNHVYLNPSAHLRMSQYIDENNTELPSDQESLILAKEDQKLVPKSTNAKVRINFQSAKSTNRNNLECLNSDNNMSSAEINCAIVESVDIPNLSTVPDIDISGEGSENHDIKIKNQKHNQSNKLQDCTDDNNMELSINLDNSQLILNSNSQLVTAQLIADHQTLYKLNENNCNESISEEQFSKIYENCNTVKSEIQNNVVLTINNDNSELTLNSNRDSISIYNNDNINANINVISRNKDVEINFFKGTSPNKYSRKSLVENNVDINKASFNITASIHEKKSPRKQVFGLTDSNISSKKIKAVVSNKIPENKIIDNVDMDQFLNNCSCSSILYSDTFLNEQRKYLDLTNSDEIDKTYLSLVNSLTDDDLNYNNIMQSDSKLHKKDNKKNISKIETPLNKRSICAICKTCKINLNDTDLKSFCLEEIPEKYENIDWSGLDRITTYPSISDVWKSALKRQEIKQSISFNNKEDSLVFPLTQQISFLMENLGTGYKENYQEQICYTPIFPLAVSFENLIQNKYKNKNQPWRMIKKNIGNNIMIFSHHKNKTFNLIFKLHSHKNYTDIIRFEKVLIQENQIRKKKSTIERVQYNEIMRKLQTDLTNMYPTSTEFNNCLEEVDRICQLAHEYTIHLLTTLVLTKSSLEFDNRNIVIKKICRIKQPGQMTQCHEFQIKLGYIEQLSYRDIIFPSKSLFDKSIQELPDGIDFLKGLLTEPMKYILKH